MLKTRAAGGESLIDPKRTMGQGAWKIRRIGTLLLVVLAASCRRGVDTPPVQTTEHQPHTESVTNWTAKTELFMEYPPLVAGRTSRFAIHLTRLDTFSALGKGTVEVRLLGHSGKFESFHAVAPSRQGIFGVDVKPSSSGEFQLAVVFSGEGIADLHKLGEITCFPTEKAAFHEDHAETDQTVTFLKEQQWMLDFATVIVEDRRLQANLRVAGEILPRSGGLAEVVVPFDGRLVTTEFPVFGARITRGQTLASILPPTSVPSDLATLELAKNEANALLQLARKDRERAEGLVAVGAAPQKRLDEARTVETTAEARLTAAQVRLAQYDASSTGDADWKGAKLFALRAPISGVLTEFSAAPGANVKAGQSLFKIVDVDTVYVSAIVPEAEFPQVRNLSGAELEIPGSEQLRRLQRLISVGHVVDTSSRTFPVIYEMDNRDHQVAVHQAVHVRLLMTASKVVPVVPGSALIDDGGRPIVFVQLTGEAFARRPVKLGVQQGGMVEVLSGVVPGERVVSRGAHLIRLASMSNQVPAHGHVH